MNPDEGFREFTADNPEQAFRAFMAEHQQPLMRTAYLLTGDPHLAEDLLQSVLVKLLGRWSKLANPRAYARRALVNEFISWRRRPGRTAELPSAQPPERPYSTEDNTLVRLAMRRALAALPPKQRAVIVLRYYEDLTETETAKLLGCSVGTVKSQAHHALAKLREQTPEFEQLKGAGR